MTFLDLYPPVTIPARPTWEDVERLALTFPTVHHAVTMVRRGDWTQEQALLALVFVLADAFQRLYAAELDRLMVTPTPIRVVLPQPEQTPKE